MTIRTDFDPEDDEALAALPMANERSLARRIALQILFEVDSAQHDAGEVLATHLQTRQPSQQVARYVDFLVNGVMDAQLDIDPVIREFAPAFPLELLAFIDRNILRIAIFEFAIAQSTPVGVAIDEAVEMAKLFGADGAPSFINGVLGALADDPDAIETMRRAHLANREADEDDDA